MVHCESVTGLATKNTDPLGSSVKQELNLAMTIKVRLTPVVPWWRRDFFLMPFTTKKIAEI